MNLSRRRFLSSATGGLATVTAPGPWAQRMLAAAEADAFRPRFAICNETFKDWPFDKAFAFAAECGYTGVEIAPFTVENDVTQIGAARRKTIRKQADTAGLEVVGLHWLLSRTKGLHLTSPDQATRRRTSSYLAELGRFCADLGGELLVFGSPKQGNLAQGVTPQQGLKYATEVIREALPQLEKSGVRLALEPLSSRITNFLSTAGETSQLVDMVGSDRCRMILDCNAMQTETKSREALIREHHRSLVHFHANDPNGQGPGFGDLDFVPLLAALRDVKFSGWISVEVFNYKPGPERLARESIDYLKKCLPRPAVC